MAIHLDMSNSSQQSIPIASDSPTNQAQDKLAARIKAAQLTNAFRARMSFAGFKSINKMEQVPINELEAKLPPPRPVEPVVGARRSIDSLLPTQSASQHHPSQPSLYTTLLSPRANKRTKRTESNVAFSPSRKPVPPSVSYLHATPDLKSSPRSKSSTRKHPAGHAKHPTAKDDMKAAATLTSLMMSSKSSAHSGTTSPRALSRTSSDASDFTPIPLLPPHDPTAHTRTPPISPKANRDDKEAAELIMFLATSPSPARKTAVKHNIPPAATRILFMDSQKSAEVPNRSLSRGDTEKTLIMEGDVQFTSSQGSTMTMVDPSFSPSKSSNMSSIPFPSSSASSFSTMSPPASQSNMSRFLESPLKGSGFQSNLNAPPIIGNNLPSQISDRSQFSPTKAHTNTLGAGIDLTIH